MSENGIVLRGQNGLYDVETPIGLRVCRAASRIRKEDGIKLLAGDRVSVEVNNDGTGFITAVLPRKNFFVRPAVANVDLLMIIVSGSNPTPQPLYIDKLCCIAESKGAEVVLVFTKSDLGCCEELEKIYEKTPYKTFTVGKDDNSSCEALLAVTENKLAVLTGASGVGKSTLINRLYPQYQARVGELSARIQRGKNTTRIAELFRAGNAYIADTPGFSMLDFEKCLTVEPEEVITLFPEAYYLLGTCRYTKCSHTGEDGCAIRAETDKGNISLSRYNSYVALYTEEKSKRRY